MEGIQERLVQELRRAGMRDVPDRFSVSSEHQAIPRETLAGIEEFIRVFDRVTTRPAWQETALREGRVYVAPNPFTYATRSDKRLLELLCRPARDEALGIRPEERELLSAHVPETWVVREEDLATLLGRRGELVFKPAHGFAGRGLLPRNQVGRSRLRRLLQRGQVYVAQRRVEKSRLRLSSTQSLAPGAQRSGRISASGPGAASACSSRDALRAVPIASTSQHLAAAPSRRCQLEPNRFIMGPSAGTDGGNLA